MVHSLAVNFLTETLGDELDTSVAQLSPYKLRNLGALNSRFLPAVNLDVCTTAKQQLAMCPGMASNRTKVLAQT